MNKPDVLSGEEIRQIVEKADYEDSKVSCPMPVNQFRYEEAVAQAQYDALVAYYEPLIQQAKVEGILIGQKQALEAIRAVAGARDNLNGKEEMK